MEALIQATQLILSLSILIVLHELGHFIPAKLFKTRVEKFYLFFDPWFSIFKIKRGGTEYGLGWLPLGGYVKISGMIDESMDKEAMKEEPKPWEFRSKPAWQRLIIMIGGVTVNFLLAIVIYIMMLAILGETFLPAENAKYGFHADSLATEIGIQNGDILTAIEGNKVADLTSAYKEIIINEAKNITVMRDGNLVELDIPGETFQKLVNSKDQAWLLRMVRTPFIADNFVEGSPAKEAGMMPGDSITGINGNEFPFFQDFRQELMQYKGETVTIQVYRNNEQKEITLELPETGLMGVYPVTDVTRFFEIKEVDYTFFQAIPAGMNRAYTQFQDYLTSLKLLASPNVKASESVGGFITIASAFSPEWDWVRFWSFTAFLSIILAIMNILPIPALDGGHVMFLLYEVITGRKPNEKFLEYAQYVGMVLLLSLLIFANGNDILRLFKN